eukprot:1711924-Amphidinium_carterae.1
MPQVGAALPAWTLLVLQLKGPWRPVHHLGPCSCPNEQPQRGLSPEEQQQQQQQQQHRREPELALSAAGGAGATLVATATRQFLRGRQRRVRRAELRDPSDTESVEEVHGLPRQAERLTRRRGLGRGVLA